jgi:hypothetical protein
VLAPAVVSEPEVPWRGVRFVWAIPDVVELPDADGLDVVLVYSPAAPFPLACPLLLPLFCANKGLAEVRTIATAKGTAYILMTFFRWLAPSVL